MMEHDPRESAPAGSGTPAAAAPAPPTDPKAAIAAKEQAIKRAQFELTQLKARQAADSAHDSESTAFDTAYQKAIDKAQTERTEAQKQLAHEADISEKLAPEHVTAIKNAVTSVDDAIKAKRDEVQTLSGTLATQTAAEASAKVDTVNAKAAHADAKRKLNDLAKAIDAQSGRVKSLAAEAKDAEEKDKDSLAYLVVRELSVAMTELDVLTNATQVAALRASVSSTWDDEKKKSAAEADATWNLGLTKDQLKSAQDALTALEKDRRKTLLKLVDAADGGDPAANEATKAAPASAAL